MGARREFRNLFWLIGLIGLISIAASRWFLFPKPPPRASSLTIYGIGTGKSREQVERIAGTPSYDGVQPWVSYHSDLVAVWYQNGWSVRVAGGQLEKGGELILGEKSTKEEMLSRLGEPTYYGVHHDSIDTPGCRYEEIDLTILFEHGGIDFRIESDSLIPRPP